MGWAMIAHRFAGDRKSVASRSGISLFGLNPLHFVHDAQDQTPAGRLREAG